MSLDSVLVESMSKEQEPEELASISLSRDEIENRQRPVGIPRRNHVPVESSRPVALWGLVIVLFLLVIFMFVQMQTIKKQSDLQLQALQLLQQKLTSTDEQANLSVDAIKILLKEQDHEIRKLWDLANKKNKRTIRANKERLDDQSKLITKQGGQIDQVSKRMDGQSKSVKTLNVDISDLEKEISGLAKANKTLKANLASVEKSADKALSGLPKNLQKDLGSINKQLKELNKALEAMDATRLRHNKRLSELEKAVKSAQSKAAPAAAP